LVTQDVLPHVHQPFSVAVPDGAALRLRVNYDLVHQQADSLTVENLENKRGVMCTVRLPFATAQVLER
jgi:hypothetical protein